MSTFVVSCGLTCPADSSYSHAHASGCSHPREGTAYQQQAKACLHCLSWGRTHCTIAHEQHPCSRARKPDFGNNCWPAGHGPAGRLRVHRHIRRRLQAGARLLGTRLSVVHLHQGGLLYKSSRLSTWHSDRMSDRHREYSCLQHLMARLSHELVCMHACICRSATQHSRSPRARVTRHSARRCARCHTWSTTRGSASSRRAGPSSTRRKAS